MCVKAAMPRHFSIVVFGLTQIAIDLEVLWHLVLKRYPLHTFWHTYLGATLMAAVLTVIGKPASQWIKTAWNRLAVSCWSADFTVSSATTWVASFTGATIGAFSHVLLDSLYHPDSEPFQPWSASNRLRGALNPHVLEIACLVAGMVGLAWFVECERRRRKANGHVALFACFLCAAMQGAAASANPLPNPGFEENDTSWAVEGTGRIVAEAAHSGKLGLRVGATNYNADGSSVTSARLPVTPCQEITLSFQARTTAACSGAYLWFYDAAGKVMTLPVKGRADVCWPNKTNGEWNAYVLRSSVPTGATAVAVWVHSSPGLTGTADYDDFAVEGIAPGVTATPPPAPRKAHPVPVIDPARLAARKRPAVIVIKLDDFNQVRGTVPAPWKRVADFLESRHIKAGFGVICQTLEEATPDYVNWIKTRHDSGQIEFWFHGWTHGPHDVDGKPHNEFAGWNDAGMKALVDRSQQAALAKLGFAFQTFGPTGSGAPGPLMDEMALRAMHDDPHMQVVLYPMLLDDMGRKIAADGKLTILDRVGAVNLESAVGVPDCPRLIQGYAENPDRPYFVLQGHPAMWAGGRFDEFVRIIDFLTAQKVVFATPSECAAIQKLSGAGGGAPAAAR